MTPLSGPAWAALRLAVGVGMAVATGLTVPHVLPAAGTDASGTPGATANAATESCTVDSRLVNSCRPWLGARAHGYPDAPPDERSQALHHEERIGRQVDIVHTYSPVGKLPLAWESDRYFALREDTYLYQNWKPARRWRDAGGGDPAINAHIDRAADAVRSLGDKRIFLTLHHEPENDVTEAGSCDTKSTASAGTAAEYRQMWRNVRERFDARGVGNVVWVMNYMNYFRWDCVVPLLYPGDDYVDWIMFNGYGSDWRPDFVANVDRFYQLLSGLSTRERDLLGKPWGIVEWGIHDASQQQAISYYQQATAALEAYRFPNLHAYMIFDSPGTHDQGGLRIAYDDQGRWDPSEQEAYRQFANHPAFREPPSC